MCDTWQPSQYEKFRNERSQPFFDLMTLVDRRSNLSVVDLGCGSGQLTKLFHDSLEAAHPMNHDYPTHLVANEVAKRPRYQNYFGRHGSTAGRNV